MKPILFSTPMVRAILDGRKTQTRRVIIPQPDRFFEVDDTPGNFHLYDVEWGLGRIYPKYQVGDILWVRETWAKRVYSDNRYYYKADNNLGAIFNRENDKWRPSIHMPREAARIFLRVANVRVERVQDISPEDCYAEGIIYVPIGEKWAEDEWAVAKYAHLWNKINEKRGLGWDTNPWVWVVAFEKISKEEAERLEGMK